MSTATENPILPPAPPSHFGNSNPKMTEDLQKARHERFKRITLILGLVLSGVSLFAFLIPELNPEMRAQDPFDSSVFFINYLIAIGYFLTITIQNIVEHKWQFW